MSNHYHQEVLYQEKQASEKFESHFRLPLEYEEPQFVQSVGWIKELMAQKKYEELLRQLDEKIPTADLKNKIYYYGMKVTIYTQQKDPEMMIQTASELKRIIPNEGYDYFRFGVEVCLLNAWFLKKDYQKAKTQFIEMIKQFGLNVKDFELYLAMIIGGMLKDGKPQEADSFLIRLEEMYTSGEVGYYVQQALLKREVEKRQYDLALKRLEHIKRNFPNKPLSQETDRVIQSIEISRKKAESNTSREQKH